VNPPKELAQIKTLAIKTYMKQFLDDLKTILPIMVGTSITGALLIFCAYFLGDRFKSKPEPRPDYKSITEAQCQAIAIQHYTSGLVAGYHACQLGGTVGDLSWLARCANSNRADAIQAWFNERQKATNTTPQAGDSTNEVKKTDATALNFPQPLDQ
jgi:hypothetical protein